MFRISNNKMSPSSNPVLVRYSALRTGVPDELTAWMNCAAENPGLHLLSDDIAEVRRSPADESEDDDDEVREKTSQVSNSLVFECSLKGLVWLE